ncbi:MAG: S1C family serine protease [Planctomycetota bacterium]|jgi:membrane-associated protease RseP (regulator of RpoE activity)
MMMRLIPCLTLSAALIAPAAAASNGYGRDFYNEPEPAPAPVRSDKRPMLGVQMTPPPRRIQEREGLAPHEGVLAYDVYDGTAAEEIGIRPGDVITVINDRPINSMQDLRDAIFDSEVGAPVTVEVSRGGERLELGGAPLQTWREDVALEDINNAAEERYRNRNSRDQEEIAKEARSLNDEADSLARSIDEMAEHHPDSDRLRQRRDQASNRLGHEPRLLPASLLALPDWSLAFNLDASGHTREDEPATSTSPAQSATPLSAWDADITFTCTVIGGAL